MKGRMSLFLQCRIRSIKDKEAIYYRIKFLKLLYVLC